MVTPDDIGNFMLVGFNADPVLPLLIPGFISSERANENVPQPYGVMSVELAAPVDYNSGIQCYPEFEVTLTVYADQMTAADASGIQARMSQAYPEGPSSPALRNTGEYVINMRVSKGSAKLDAMMRNANDVAVCTFGWRVWCVSLTNVE